MLTYEINCPLLIHTHTNTIASFPVHASVIGGLEDAEKVIYEQASTRF